ncbi:MAG: hypothetical protein DRH43_08755 [Deltaproteobacteria bacterium]|nr:MAG: hypothetical protein DRH43_08755 [Deltaproteobacteria bacterium]
MLNYGFENLLITLGMAEGVTQLTRNSYRSEFILLTQLACYFFPPLNTELLEPKHRLIYSFRSDKKYRAIFICLPEDKVEIIAVTKHYRLLHFGDILKVARRRYRQFVKNGTDQGRRPEFQGGGLIRSAGGNKGACSVERSKSVRTGMKEYLAVEILWKGSWNGPINLNKE